MKLIECDLRSVLETTAKALSLLAQNKGLELTCEIEPEVPDVIIADPTRLRQIVLNLMGNAIKFTERGEVAVTVALDSSLGESLQLHFTVRDTGLGIPPEKQKSCDVQMPEMDGFSFVARMRKHPRLAGQVVMLLTSGRQPGTPLAVGNSA